jgi:hypothetical protein
MNNLKKYISLLGTISFIVSACASKNKIVGDGYRYVSFEEVPRGEMGKLTGKAYWNFRTNHIAGPIADSFHVYGNFDSIRFHAPSSPPRMFRKTDIRAESWKAKPSYGKLHFVGNFTADHLPGAYMSFYFTKDRRYILEALYTNPGMLSDAILFHKDSVNILKKQGIVVEPDY